MKVFNLKYFLLLSVIFFSCKSTPETKVEDLNPTKVADTNSFINTPNILENETNYSKDSVYANSRFRNVTVNEVATGIFEIAGEARVFEATLNYILRQEKEESDVAFGTASNGAPEWGKFGFTINATIFKPNVPLYLILFESSAKDGSRQDELSIRLF